MTAHQLAIAAGAEAKWILNSAALLKRRIRHTAAEARWWGLVRLLTEGLGLPLQPAAEAASRSLRSGAAGEISVIGDRSGSASVMVDLRRYHSTFLGNLSRALVHETPKRRGRPSSAGQTGRTALDAAVRFGLDLGLLKTALTRTPAERLQLLEANARFIRDLSQRRK